jgi:hypothetical protein
MPYISDDDYKRYMEIIKNREKKEEENKEKYINTLISKFESFKKEYRGYGTIEAMALKFSKFLDDYFEETNEPFLPLNWLEMQKYLTDKCLTTINGKVCIKRSFRNNLRDYGYCIYLNRKYNTMRIKKCVPRKTKNKQ